MHELSVFDILIENAGNKKVAHSEDKKTKDPNDEKKLAKLLEPGEEINSQNSQGYTALHRAAKFGQWDDVRLLLKNGANVTLLTNTNDTALHFACEIGHIRIVDDLIRNGSHINATNFDGQQCIHLASANGFYSNLTQISI